jgi:hypothetical protein
VFSGSSGILLALDRVTSRYSIYHRIHIFVVFVN